MAELTLTELARRIGGTLEGSGEARISAAAGLEEATPSDISFLANVRYQSQVATTAAAAVIVAADYDGPTPPDGAVIRCEDPYFAYREAMVVLYGFRETPFAGISEQASIDPSAQLGQAHVAPFVTICRNARVADGCVLYPGVFIGPDVTLDASCTLYPNVTIYDGCVLGRRVTVHASSSIGVDGFGYATHAGEDGTVRHEKIPPAGNVVLEDDVEIGSCCAIERATMGPTVIGTGTKFADLVAIGHGTKLGQHCLMVSQSGIAGSTVVGNYCAFAGQAGVVGHIRIGDGVRVGAQAGVTNDLPPGQEVLGSPAVPRAEARRIVMSTMKVPELRNQVKRLTREVQALQDRLAQLEAKG